MLQKPKAVERLAAVPPTKAGRGHLSGQDTARHWSRRDVEPPQPSNGKDVEADKTLGRRVLAGACVWEPLLAPLELQRRSHLQRQDNFMRWRRLHFAEGIKTMVGGRMRR